MFIIKYYILIAIAATCAAFYTNNLYFTIILGWVALSLATVSFAYASRSPWIFRKRDTGSIPLYVRWIFIPFLLGAQLYNSWQRRVDSVPPIQKIDEHLYLACRLFPSDVSELEEKNISAILDATAEFSGLNWTADDKQLDYLNIPVLDHQAPETEDVIKAINWIHNHIRRNKGVVIHCALGRGRSVLIMAAYLIAANKANSVEQAIKQINKVRGTARLNSYQCKKLTQLCDKDVLKLNRKALLIANPVSGAANWESVREQLKQALSQRYQLQIALTEKNKPAQDIIEENSLLDFEVVFACGGDGTVNQVAQKLIGTDTILGIIPLGTTNALSHVLYGSRVKVSPIETACDIILSGHHIVIDAAKCNGDIMLLASGVGLEEKMIAGAQREDKNKNGELAYLQSLFEALSANETQEYSISIDGMQTSKVVASSIIIANAAPATTLLAQGKGQPNPTDGVLDMTIIDTTATRSEPIGKLAAQAFLSGGLTLDDSEALSYQQVKEVNISTQEELDYVVDGEVRKAKELHITVLPKALRVFASEGV